MKREVYLKSIIQNLSILKYQVQLSNAINFYDINITAEDFYPGLLNLILDFEFVNANAIEKNATSIDLVDEKNEFAIQVTSDNSSDKIKHTINKFVERKSYNKYKRLVMLILTEKKKYTKDFDTQGKFQFDRKSDIWDIDDLIQKIRFLPIEKIKEINEYLQKEIDAKCESVGNSECNEVETILDLIEFISGHKQVKEVRDVVVDPEYKIDRRFREFASNLRGQYVRLLSLYGNALEEVLNVYGRDEAQDIVTVIYLQDISIKFLDEYGDNPVKALAALTDYFEEKLSTNGKKYDCMAIKFYLLNELINCSVFPNERGEYSGSEF